MEEKNDIKDKYLSKAQSLLEEIESGNSGAADRIIEELTHERDKNMFQEIGKLTRELHEALNSFRLDAQLTEIAGKDIPDARERLQYVITMTEESANKTLNAVEETMPVCDVMEERSKDIHERWQRFMHREMEPQEFRELCKEIDDVLEQQHKGSAQIRTALTEILMAQDFQDLTGQIITRVITLVSDLESSLVKLIKDSGGLMAGGEATEKTKSEREKLDGPQVPGVESEGAVSGQDEVDDLLSSLGF
jgi:chemotaxis protein CheZ